MTTSGDLYKTESDPNMPSDPLHKYYYERGLTEMEDRISALEKQFQEFPNKSMDRKKRLIELENRFYKTFVNVQSGLDNAKAERNKYRELYKQVDDGPAQVNGMVNPLQNVTFERDYGDGLD